ncbi:RNA ligase family protein [Deinococcus sp. QL22]|uniref:RNA ligase family protein n=1 Tax=Deinococcus sp. QL22 TaxID=2939437 RepID=UPI0020183DFC|nr:RNA ligase family protein [Deinococcus sp. QL22]UQN10668.1 RNA ligase family protein [Deinococcus sp. QL22]
MTERPLGMKTYGRIPHLPGSHLTPADRTISEREARRATRDALPGDQVWVHEKLDGSNLAVARIGDQVLALTRAGYRAESSRRPQAQLFAAWVEHHAERFLGLLQPGERVIGEWLLFAHGTQYQLAHEPFVAFDLMQGKDRVPWAQLTGRLGSSLVTPQLHAAQAGDPSALFQTIGTGGHGAVERPEGLVYRVERGGQVDFLAKWVRPDYQTGLYFEADEAVLPNQLRSEDAELLIRLGHRLGLPDSPC